MFFFTTSYNLVIPEMNTIVSELGGADYKGWLIGLFTVSAGISRPFSGKLADYIGRKRVMFFGLLICALVSASYLFTFSVWFLLLLRFLHGFSTGFFPTGATALITDVLPEKHRGTGMGIWGTFISLGIGVGQGCSSLIVDHFGKNGLFLVATLIVGMSYLLLVTIKETLPKKVHFHWNLLHIKKDELIEKKVIPVAIVMFLSAICSGIIFVLSPDMSNFLHIENKGSFFVFYVLSTIAVRLTTGRISDIIGRRQMLLIGMSLLTISMVMIGLSTSATWFTFSSIMFGVATGTSSPTIFAWTADLSPDHRRGIGAGTMFIALEFGIFTGSIITNLLYDDTIQTVLPVFLFGASMAAITVVYLIWHIWIAKKPSTP